MKFNDLLFPYLRDVLENPVPPIEELIPLPYQIFSGAENISVFPALKDPWWFIELEESDLLRCVQLFQDHLRNGTRKQKFLDAFKNAAREVADGMRFCGIKRLDTQDRFDLILLTTMGKLILMLYLSLAEHFNIGNLGIGSRSIRYTVVPENSLVCVNTLRVKSSLP